MPHMEGIFINGEKAKFHPEDILDTDASQYTEEIGESVTAYLTEHITNPSNPPIDTSLSIAGAAADAKETGDKISELKEDLTAFPLNLAPAYSNAATYDVGDICTYQGTLYSCIIQITTAEDWTDAHWTATNMATDVSQLKSKFDALGITEMIMPLDPNKFSANRYYAITDNSIGTATINTHTGSTSWNIYGAYQVNDGDRFVIPKNGNSRADVGLYDTDGILRGYVNGVRGQATEVICSINGYTIGYISLSVTSDGNANDVFIIKIFEPYYTENTSKYIADAKTGRYVFLANEYRLSVLDGLIDKIPTDNLIGKTLYVVGDSISYGSNNDGQSYADKIANKHNMQLTKYTTAGATWKQNTGRTCLLTVVNNITVSQPVTEPDYMIISGGYNDAQNSILSTLGDIKISETDDNSASFNGVFDTDTFCGSIERAIYLIRKYYPNTKLMYVITYDITSQKQWAAVYAPKIRNICEKWSVPMCDLMRISGLICNSYMPEYQTIFTDGVHPNNDGQNIMAEYVDDVITHLYN